MVCLSKIQCSFSIFKVFSKLFNNSIVSRGSKYPKITISFTYTFLEMSKYTKYTKNTISFTYIFLNKNRLFLNVCFSSSLNKKEIPIEAIEFATFVRYQCGVRDRLFVCSTWKLIQWQHITMMKSHMLIHFDFIDLLIESRNVRKSFTPKMSKICVYYVALYTDMHSSIKKTFFQSSVWFSVTV